MWGHASRSGTALVLTTAGVQRGTAVARLPEGERWIWNEEEILGLKGKPWDWNERGEERIAAAPPDTAPRAARMEAPVIVAQAQPSEPRDVNFYVTKANIMDPTIGPTARCLACDQLVAKGKTSVIHTNLCRERVVGILAARGDERLQGHREAKEHAEAPIKYRRG